ncbi:hypothetical protein J1N35_019363 [Gossypium stocksii]|uniref:Uncharacterized protein n=1 Tax=Gossypium stocksii TaxID=47602 RepID=A0A9D3VQT4_9ROSI|nr:hypothetical protein J1N35_019363 [Gossypium stocksii]
MTSSSSGWQPTCDFGLFEMYTRKDDVLLTTSTDEGTSNMTNVGGTKTEDGNKSNVDPPREPNVDGSEVALFSEPEPVLTEPEDGEGGVKKI